MTRNMAWYNSMFDINDIALLPNKYDKKKDKASLEKINTIISAMKIVNTKDNYGNGIGVDLINAFSSLSNHLKLTNFFIP